MIAIAPRQFRTSLPGRRCLPLATLTLLFALCLPQPDLRAAPQMEHGIVSHEEGRFLAHAANRGVWSWGNEILVCYSNAAYHYYPDGHSRDPSKPRYLVLARSTDGGRTWETHHTEAFSTDNPATLDRPMDLSNPDFAFRSRNNLFWYSEDRGHKWRGPFLFPDFGLENALSARTDYLVYDEDTLTVFLSAKDGQVEAGIQDRAFCAKTDDGGLSWSFNGWMTHYPYNIRSVMPSTVRLHDHELLSVVRRRFDAHDDEALGRVDINFLEAEYSLNNGEDWEKRGIVAFTDTEHRNGNPPALVKLPDGRVAVMYGYRGVPYGMRAKVSADGGKSWGHEIILRDDGLNWDLGYPRAVVLPDGRILCLYYIATAERKEQHIAWTIWQP